MIGVMCCIGSFAMAQTADIAHGKKGHECSASCKPSALKNHSCSADCHKAGKCVMAHGEKGHKCKDACMKAESKSGGKAHSCSADCKKSNFLITTN